MAISRKQKRAWQELSEDEQDRIVRMAWEDRTTFDSITEQFSLTANEVVKFMRTQLDTKAYKRWRKRASERGHLKHKIQVEDNEPRFKCTRQRLDGSTKGWK
jgi:uncharacterized protein (TIGR03643 family)